MIEPNQMMTKEYGWMEQQQQNIKLKFFKNPKIIFVIYYL